jgi:hypothetical protein
LGSSPLRNVRRKQLIKKNQKDMKANPLTRGTNLVLAITALVTAGSLPANAETKVISINWKQFDGEVNDPVEPYGVEPASGWINSIGGVYFSHLRTSGGGPSTVNLAVSGTGGAAGAGTYYGGLDNTPMRAGLKIEPAGASRTLTLSGLAGTFTTYDIIVYIAGYNGANNTVAVGDGSTTYYCKVPNPFTTDLVQSTDTADSDPDDEGTYVRFSGLTGDTQVIDVARQGGEVAIGGIQIVGEAAPTTVEGPVSINWKEFSGDVNDPVEPYGVVAGSNWLNTIGGTAFSNLLTSGGGASTIDLTVTAEGSAGGNDTYNFNTLDDTPMRAGLRVSTAEGSRILNLSGLSGTFSTYDIIVYVAGYNGADNTAVVSDGTTTYYCKVPAPHTADLIQSMDTVDSDPDDEGTYVRFSGLSGDTQTITMSRQGGEVGIGGLQITGEPVLSSIPVVSVDHDAGSGEITVVFESQGGTTYSAYGGTHLADTSSWPEISTTDIVDGGGTAIFSHTPAGDPTEFFLQIRED